MKLTVIDRGSIRGADRIDARYDRSTETTIIDVDCDVLTLGITATILQQKYEAYLKTLDDKTALRVLLTVKEACSNEKH